MRHRYAGRKLGRDTAHREALFRNLMKSLFEHEVIKTTVAKAKELRRFAEPMITLAKNDSVANRRLAFSRLGDKAMVGKLFSDIGPRFKTRPGGYLRVLKCGYRMSDAAPMAIIELVEREGAAPPPVKPKKKVAKKSAAKKAAPKKEAAAEKAPSEKVAKDAAGEPKE